ncbi:MAG: septum formation initiator family protein [Holophagaceae bacterium]|nr:septum formation initiator family protein [Holophagaceae bacterium]
MNLAWLLKSRTVGAILALSGAVTSSVLMFSSEGLPSLRKRQAELFSHKTNLYAISIQNRNLRDEVSRLIQKDPELMEALVRRLGYDLPGETVYLFGDQSTTR